VAVLGSNHVSKNVVLLVSTMSAILTASMGSSINIALPTIGREFSINAVLLSWVVTVYPLTSAAFLIPFGRIADIYGRRKIFNYGVFVFTFSSLLSSLAISATMLISFRILQGIGAAMVFTTGIAMLTSVFPTTERGKALGINVAAVYTGLAMGPFLGGLLTEHLGWRSIFWVNVPLGLITIVTTIWKLKADWADAKGAKFDLVGSFIYGIALFAIIYGVSLLPAWPGILIISIGTASGFVFIKWEKKVSSPILNMNLFSSSKTFAFSNLAALINYSATFAVTFLLSLYLQYSKGYSPQHAGLILVTMPSVQAVFSPLSGRLSDKIEPRILASLGMGLTTLGLAFLTCLKPNTTIAFIIGSLVISGFGFALFSSPNTNAIMGAVNRSYYGVASATLAAMRQIGSTFSMGIVMLIFSIHIGRVEVTPEYYQAFIMSVKIAFIVFSALCCTGIFASLARGKVRQISR
jgi:EmrB/QacA subfamily drug resistance transporter